MTSVAADTVVDGRYRVVARIGSGGMADVWCAEDLQLGRRVALKLLHGRFADDREFVERFRREASSAAGLQHPNVVSIYDRGEWDGTSYIAMEFVDGEPLKALIDREGPLEPARAIDLTIQVLRAARFAHRRGIVHRDLKPHNVIVDGEGRAKVADFGIARAGASDMTETGSILGTAQYLSPEQAQGHAVSARSDLYSIGVLLHELLTGRVPFDGDSAVTIALKHVAETPVPPSRIDPRVPPALDAVVLRALAKDPEERFADADAFIAALEAARAGAAAPPQGPATSAFGAVSAAAAPPLAADPAAPDRPEPARRRPIWPWVLGGLLLAGVVAAAVVLLTRTETRAVPRVVGAERASAARRLRDEGFRVAFDTVRSPRPVDEVIQQSPGPGADAEVGSVVSLSVSGGPGRAPVPDVQGLAEAAAERRVERAGFRSRVRRVADGDVPAGQVVRTTPPGGTSVTRGSTITIVVSTGPEQVVVPGVVGRPLAEARSALEAAGLAVGVDREETADAEPGTVLRQTPGEGAQVDEGTTVTVTVAEELELTEVPTVVGATESQASEFLAAAGFTVSVQSEPVTDPTQDEVVLRQRPAGGEAEAGSRVTIVVGRFDDSSLDPEGTGPQDGDGGTGGATPEDGADDPGANAP